MNKRQAALTLGLALAAWLAFFGDKTSSSDIAEPAERRPPLPAARTQPSGTAVPPPKAVILALADRESLIGGAPADKAAHGIFGTHTWMPPPPPPPKPLPPAPPSAPPLPFTYLGKKLEEREWEVYIARGEQTFIVRPQTVIENMYRVDSVQPPTLTMTYLPLNQQQTLTIGGTD